MAISHKQLIHFHYLVPPFYFPHRNELKKFIAGIFRSQGEKLDHLNYIFCSDAYLLEINRQYLKHNNYTDIITFPFSKKGEPILSDIYISLDRVKDNAQSFKSSSIQELYRVMFHGALHLCGHKDKTPTQKQKMRSLENHYLYKYNVSRDTVSTRNS